VDSNEDLRSVARLCGGVHCTSRALLVGIVAAGSDGVTSGDEHEDGDEALGLRFRRSGRYRARKPGSMHTANSGVMTHVFKIFSTLISQFL
jgi:hypothetical protein